MIVRGVWPFRIRCDRKGHKWMEPNPYDRLLQCAHCWAQVYLEPEESSFKVLTDDIKPDSL